MARNPLEYAYKNDFVDNVDFSDYTLKKYEKAGLLKYKYLKKKRKIYWLTNKGLKCYRGKLPKSKCRITKKRE